MQCLAVICAFLVSEETQAQAISAVEKDGGQSV
jgi:hypothetical protein